jgi:1,2-diacylglycerol 3-alpha-glucosyltransferase
MKILVMTNTYHPFTGGVPRSIDTFVAQYRKMGHTVKIVAPSFEGQEEEEDVVRVPAIQHFNGTDFSVQLPIPFYLSDLVDAYGPDIIHSQHPFLIGNAALRLAARRETPLVYTFHTFYDRYLHYVPGGSSAAMKRFVNTLVVGYANLCDHVIAPSRSVAEDLVHRGVTKPVDVIPTGVDVSAISRGDGRSFRARHGVPEDAFVVGFVSRIAEEKNIPFLCDAVLAFLEQDSSAWFLIAGSGPLEEELRGRFAAAAVGGRILFIGTLTGPELHGAYNAMNVFAFASKSETQGLVVAEAMAAGTPVVALQASGVGEVVEDGSNGRLVEDEDREVFMQALRWIAARSPEEYQRLSAGARDTAAKFADDACARKVLALFGSVRRQFRQAHEHESAWDEFVKIVATEWNILANIGAAAGEALTGSDEDPSTKESPTVA